MFIKEFVQIFSLPLSFHLIQNELNGILTNLEISQTFFELGFGCYLCKGKRILDDKKTMCPSCMADPDEMLSTRCRRQIKVLKAAEKIIKEAKNNF